MHVAQEFRLLQEVNNLRIRVGIEPERQLNTEERARALERLRSGKDINLAKPTRDLKLPSQTAFNLSRGGRSIVKRDETTDRLISKKERGKPRQDIFGDRWRNLSLDQRNQIVRFMLDTDDPAGVQRKALTDWGLNETQAKVISDLGLPDGYSNLSEKAIRKLLPHLESGLFFSDAVQAAGYKHHSDFRSAEAHASLPYYGQVLQRDAIGADPTKDPAIHGEPARYGRFPNPTVHIGLNQLRRVVNRLIEVYGKPEEIVVELARDLKSNHEQKRRYQQQQKEGEERNQRFDEMLQSAEQESNPLIRRKLRLWEEQGPAQARVCPYSGRVLSFEMVVSSQTEIDHILPFSQTLNDSMANKVVCTAQANRDKGDRSPYEAFGYNPTGYNYDDIQARAAALPDNKRWRFDPDAMQEFQENRDFLDRQLNETSYLARTACLYLAHLYNEKTEGRRLVRAIPGHMTYVLRRGWGLEGMLRVTPAGEIVRKQRDDHRHHAIDAFVVASTTQGLLQRFAHASRSRRQEAAERLAAIAGDVRPWDGFSREELQPFLDGLVISYKPDHGNRGQSGHTTGQLHNETAYGLVGLSESGPSEVVVRKPLTALKRSDLILVPDEKPTKGVRDLALRVALLKLWDEVRGKTTEFAERAATEGVRINGRIQRVRRVRLLDQQRVIPIRDVTDKPYKGYLPGGNEFADVWRLRDGSWRTVAVPTFDANQPEFDIELFRPSDKKTSRPDPTAKRLMRLHIDDLGALGKEQNRRIVRLRKITNAKAGVFVVLDDHNEANVADRVGKDLRESRYSARQLQRLGFRKVGVDEIGRVLDPGPHEK
ncbi:MAG: type II CRISPR RNA-guided endonuclease Cas9 [Chloroflexi bacterium]|nr:type II CRISPR RNA-guided endonuclease Cas9 [Chloroflexota bacterium]